MNQLLDNRDMPTTVSTRSALEKYEKALVQLQSYHGDPVETIDAAIEEDPNFVMAHCLRAHCGSAMADSGFLDHQQESLDGAKAAAHVADEREKRHIAAIEAWLDGSFKQSVDILESILVDHPRDILALQIAHLSDFYLGDAHNLRDRVARVLPSMDRSSSEYGYALGMYAFGLEECNEYARAEEVGNHALDLNSKDVWAVHAVAHVMEMQGRQNDGIDLYTSRENDWAPDNGFAVHNWWHLALFYLDLQDFDKVLEIYDSYINDGSVALEMLDASALLWRLYLMGQDTGDRWQVLADKWEKTVDQDTYYCFNDCHAIMSFVASGRNHLANRVIEMLERSAEGESYSAFMTRNVGLPLGRALCAFGEGEYGVASELLSGIRYTANQFGGSHAQRDLISQTLIESSIRAKKYNFARALLAERAAKKSNCALTWQNTARVMNALQLRDEADRASRQALELLRL